MTRTIHVLTGEYPPMIGGVGDYTQLVARGLAQRGCDVHVWCPSVEPSRDPGLEVHKLPDGFGPRSRRVLDEALGRQAGTLIVQYVPQALGARGVNVPLCLWLLRLGRRGTDVRVMFHEPYFYFSWGHLRGNVLALLQRLMAGIVLRAGAVNYVSTTTWTRYLEPYAPAGVTLRDAPVPSTVPSDASSAAIAWWRARFAAGVPHSSVVGHFGTYGGHVGCELTRVIPVLLRARPATRFVCIGHGGDRFAATLAAQYPDLAGRVEGTGALQREKVPAALQACDLVLQPYPDGVTTRRTSVMASLANGVAVVTTDGPLTEPVWAESGAVVLVKASDADALASSVGRLLDNPEARSTAAAAGRRAYVEHFALDHTLDLILDSAPAGAGA